MNISPPLFKPERPVTNARQPYDHLPNKPATKPQRLDTTSDYDSY